MGLIYDETEPRLETSVRNRIVRSGVRVDAGRSLRRGISRPAGASRGGQLGDVGGRGPGRRQRRSLEWMELPEQKASRILALHDIDYADKESQPSQFEWAMKVTLGFKKAVLPLVKKFA